MCGITGIINLNGNIGEIPRHISSMTNAIRHRGPDGEGFLLLKDSEIISAFGKDTPENVINSSFNYAPKNSIETISGENIHFAFGHRRLSIIDISSAGHQPMCDLEKKIWIVFNGEIYNYLELREELSHKGFLFVTNTDTEVILQSYLHWGEDCVNHFNGMWAFVIYDSHKNILFGSRDRVGVKPFYYYKDENIFVFASEQKALLKLSFVRSGINLKAASDFLVGDVQYIERGEENMFKNIYEILPSHNFRFDLKTKSFLKWSYYTLKTNTSFAKYDEKEFEHHRNETEKLIVQSVKLRLRSDVPIGSCLSGGIDSSAIVGILKKLTDGGQRINLGGKMKVFTLTFDDLSIDESKWAKYVVDQTHAEWNLVSPTGNDLLKDFRDLNYAQDIPVCSTGTYGQFRLMHSAKEAGIKVMLDGQGGDELFGGYYAYSVVAWKALLQKWKFKNLFTDISYDGKSFFNLKHFTKDFLKRQYISLMPISLQKAFYKSYFKQNSFINDGIINEYIRSGGMKSELEVSGSNSINEALQKDFTNTRLKMYLMYEDRTSMWHSIEARAPFADDHNLVEYVFSVPGAYKIHNGINKYLLREAMKTFLPIEIKNRKDKLGLATPIERWMKQIQNQCMYYFDDSLNDFMDVKKIKNRPNRFFNISNHADGIRVFRMISFAVWKNVFNL